MIHTITRFRPPSQLDPAIQGKIHALCAIKSHVETSMISPWICDNEFALIMDQHIDAHTITGKTVGRDSERFMSEKLITFTSIFGEVAWFALRSFHYGLEMYISHIPCKTRSKRSACCCGIAYQNLGAPKWI